MFIGFLHHTIDDMSSYADYISATVDDDYLAQRENIPDWVAIVAAPHPNKMKSID